MNVADITQGRERLEVTKEDRKATRSEGTGLEVSANHALMRQRGGGKDEAMLEDMLPDLFRYSTAPVRRPGEPPPAIVPPAPVC